MASGAAPSLLLARRFHLSRGPEKAWPGLACRPRGHWLSCCSFSWASGCSPKREGRMNLLMVRIHQRRKSRLGEAE